VTQMGVFYLMSKRVLRSIPYGPKARNRLDMYIPGHHWQNPDVCIPVVIYVTGEASGGCPWEYPYAAAAVCCCLLLSAAGKMMANGHAECFESQTPPPLSPLPTHPPPPHPFLSSILLALQ